MDQILCWILAYLDMERVSPSIREIVAGTMLAGPSAALGAVRYLRARGWLHLDRDLDPHAPRCLNVTRAGRRRAWQVMDRVVVEPLPLPRAETP